VECRRDREGFSARATHWRSPTLETCREGAIREQKRIPKAQRFGGRVWRDFRVRRLGHPASRLEQFSTDLFAAGSDVGGAFILHYDGVAWTRTEIPGASSLAGLWGSSASDVYAVGNGIFHYDGQTWTKIDERSGADIWGPSPTDVYVVGASGLILHGTP
jgi:hypothetical protein